MAEGPRSHAGHQRRSGRWRPLARSEAIEYDRVLFFSDAVFAIAITLLIVDLQVPDVPNLQSGTQLRESVPRMAGFAFSFTVIGLFWIGHHELFRRIKGLDRSLILLNLLFLGCIAFLLYPTSLLSAAADQVPATVFYAVSIAAAGLAGGRDLAVRHPHPRAGPPRRPTGGVPLDPAADPPGPGGVPALDPGRHRPARPGPVPVAPGPLQRPGDPAPGTPRARTGDHRARRPGITVRPDDPALWLAGTESFQPAGMRRVRPTRP
jgi:uncharacterized membrane protein